MISLTGEQCCVAFYAAKLKGPSSLLNQMCTVIINYIICDVTAKCFYCVMPDPCGLGVKHFHTSEQRKPTEYISHVYLSTGIHLNVHWCTLKCIPGK